jgi:hypothetical protein
MSPKPVRLFLSVALCATSALLVLPGSATTQGKAPKKPQDQKLPKLLAGKPLDTGVESDDLRQLLRARYNAALEEARLRYRQLNSGAPGATSLSELLDTLRRLLVSGMAVMDVGKNRVLFLEEYVDLTRRIERTAADSVRAGVASGAAAAQARYMRLDAEIQLLRTRRLLAGPKPAPQP